MDKYIKDLSFVIQNCEMENTYKMVWVRSIVETCVLNPNQEIIHFDQLSPKIFGYYWNQTIFFNLEQGPNTNKRPNIHQIVMEEVKRYRETFGYKPVFYSKVDEQLGIPVSTISSILTKDVCWRFLKVGKDKFDLYELDKVHRTIKVHRPGLIHEYADILFDLINYRWTQKLEEFNSSPRISKKVKGTDRENVRRKSLTRFRRYLDIENPNRVCFQTGLPIEDNNLSIDHVIPWSYVYSDDLWNLVYVDKSLNSSKSNRIPDQPMIQKLEERNKRLLTQILESGLTDKIVEDLKLSIDRDYVRKNWVGFKG
tara:strand:+ start:245 stop:1177 length:933 start_codon:yes stop_codon:yes gene_type:complete